VLADRRNDRSLVTDLDEGEVGEKEAVKPAKSISYLVGGSAGADVAEEATPGRGKTAADAIQVEAQTLRWIEQFSGGFVQ
jgi:hypothetical protein